MSAATKVEIVDSELKPLEKVLAQWLKVIALYTKAIEDHCWGYNERASIGSLAGAAWLTKGWIALEEYCSDKINSEKAEPASRRGRCDLYLTNENDDYAFEFKQAFQQVGTGERGAAGRASSAASAAWEDIGRVSKLEAATRLAGVFVIPSVPKLSRGRRIDAEAARQVATTWLDAAREHELFQKAGAITYSLRPEDSATSRGVNRIYPGVVLLLKRYDGRQSWIAR